MNVRLESSPRLRGRVLFVMRVVWGVMTLVCIVTLIASLPPYFDALRRPGEAIRAGLTQVGLSADLFAGVSLGGQVVSAAIFILVSLVIVWRTPHDRMAWFVAFALTTFGTAGLASAAGPAGTPYNSMFQALIATQPAWFPLTALLSALGWVLMGFFILLFPDGRLTSRWTWVFGLEWIIFNGLWFFFPNSPFSPPHWPPALFIVGVGFNFLTALFAQVYRYRYVSTPLQRQQTKWLVLGSGLVIALNLVFLTPSAFPALIQSNLQVLFLNLTKALLNLLVSVFPLSIGLAMLRYRLWDVDLLIRRTLQYSVLSGLLALIYFGSVVLVQSLFLALTGQNQNQLVTVVSTLAIAALFAPLRRRVQDVIDRRFYRRKYDAAKTLADFAATARDETDLDKLTASLINVVQETIQPEHVSLWLRNYSTPTRQARPAEETEG